MDIIILARDNGDSSYKNYFTSLKIFEKKNKTKLMAFYLIPPKIHKNEYRIQIKQHSRK